MRSTGVFLLAIAALFVPSAMLAEEAAEQKPENSCRSTPVDDGCGELTLPDGAMYFGMFQGARVHGEGIVVFPDNSTLEGDLIDGGDTTRIVSYTLAGGQNISGPYSPPKFNDHCLNPYAFKQLGHARAHYEAVFLFEVDETGHMMSVAIMQPDTSQKFMAITIDQVEKCGFAPATVGGKPVKSISSIRQQFNYN